jgi:hypothetical protein
MPENAVSNRRRGNRDMTAAEIDELNIFAKCD